MTQIAGTGLALFVYKLIAYSNLMVTVVCVIVFFVAYFNYRRIIAEMGASIDQAERAERKKAETEKQRAEEAVQYAEELSVLLKIEEDTSKALRKSREQFQHAALHDSLTALPNRASFGVVLKKIIEENKAENLSDTFVLFIDLARFKTINDSFGHSIGDKILILVAKRFLRSLRPKDKVFRLAGDEFAVVLKDLSTALKAEKVAWKIHQKISQPFALSGNKINVGLNIGIAPCHVEYNAPEDVLRDADIAMHFAKENGSGVEIFSEELRSRFVQRAQIESELPFAVGRKELKLFYQPIISLQDGSVVGFEALLRWFHSKRGFVSPAEFIPIAEETGHIIPITTWILKETCQQLADWRKISHQTRDLMMSVNISGKHLSFQSLLIDVEDALEQAKLLPSALKLEITESAAMQDAEQTVRMLSHLKSLGVKLSIDDFGTGYSSLSNLHQLPFDTLKIDRSFVMNVGENGENSQILQTIISLAKNLRMRVIAEGIETENQLVLLRNLGCEYGQGYLISKPLPSEAMEELLYRKNQWANILDTGELVVPQRNKGKETNISVF
jgi:diguanylate cyclase (GGDEF)-like protein